MADGEVWNAYSPLFDLEVSPQTMNLEVKYIRSILTAAGPIQEGNKRYASIKEDKMEQEEVATRFQHKLRDMTESGESRYAGIRPRIFA